MALELTAKCNFRCPYCHCVWHEYPALAKLALDAAGWRRALEKYVEDEVKDILFTGGDALLGPALFEIHGHARSFRQGLPFLSRRQYWSAQRTAEGIGEARLRMRPADPVL